MKTLVVEADAAARRACEEIGASLGLEVTACANGEAGWAAFDGAAFPLLMLDWSPGGIDGLGLCRRVRQSPKGAGCYILMVTAGARPDDFHEALLCGADDYLPKPVEPDVLRVRLAIAARQASLLQERLQAEAALRKSQERFQMVARATNDAIWDWDLNSNSMEWNEGIQTLFGYAPAEIGPDSTWWAENIHPEDRDRIMAGLKKSLAGTEHSWTGEYLFCRADGFFSMVMDRACIVRDARGTAVRMVGSMMDITDRRQDQRTIEKLATFVRYNPNPVLEFAADGTVSYANDAARELTQALGKRHPQEILPRDFIKVVRECLLAGRHDLRRETHLGGRIVNWAFFPIPALNAVHCYGLDITERVNLETQLRQTQKLESLGQLSAGVAHDFNNILTIIQGYSTLLLNQQGLDLKLSEPLNQISVAAGRAANLTRQLLLFSRKQPAEARQLDFNEVVGNMTRMLQRILGEDIKLEFHPAEELPPVHADGGMLEQVLLNLAVNARDAMPRGGRLTLRTRIEDVDPARVGRAEGVRPGRFVNLTVTDTGTGIPPEILARIFEPFFTTKEVGKGTGLGLATVMSIVKQHAGLIEVASEVGHGTTFSILLPVAPAPARTAATGFDTSLVRGGPETILLAEDDPALRVLARTILQRYGYKVLDAATGKEALALWAEHRDRIALLLTDMVMPDEMSGRELAGQLLAEQPALKVIYSSGYSDLAALGVELAPDQGFLQKPFEVERLIRTVRACLDGRPLT